MRRLPAMGFWDRVRRLGSPVPLELRHTDTTPSAYPLEWQLDAVIWHQGHGPISSEAVPAVYAAIDLIAASVARLDTYTSTPLSRRPDPFSTRFDFLFETVWSLAWAGDAYWLLTPTDRGVDSMAVLEPDRVAAEWDDTLRRRLRRYTYDGREVPSERIRHLRFHPRPGELYGLSPIDAARQTWEGAAHSEAWGSSLFSASGVPSGVLKTPGPLTPAEAAELKAEWNAARNGTRNTAVLEGGIEYQPVELSPSDIGWLETRASTAQEVARIFHIPSDMLEVSVQGGSTSVTYRNLAAIGADFVEWCLNPYLQIVEESWATLAGQPPLQFDKRPLYREDLETRARTLQALTASGVALDQALRETSFGFVDAEVPV